MEINKLAENNRLSFIIELSSTAWQDDENAIDLEHKTAQAAGIYNSDLSQIDIVHRVSDKGTTPLIVLFNRKIIELIFADRKINCLKSKSTVLSHLLIMMVVIVKLVCQALREKLTLSIWMKA